MDYADGTYLTLESGPFACRYVAGRALLPNGETRALDFNGYGFADTFFSVPCRVSFEGQKIRGYATVETRDGWSTPTDDDPAVVRFRPYTSKVR